jgi:hypothetical protein
MLIQVYCKPIARSVRRTLYCAQLGCVAAIDGCITSGHIREPQNGRLNEQFYGPHAVVFIICICLGSDCLNPIA